MFEGASTGIGGSPVDLTRCSVRQLAGLFEQNHRALMQAECQALVLAAAWADAHEVDADAGDYQPLIERARFVGGDGTPAVSEFCASELGALQATGMIAAQRLIADALDVRYRLPRLWVQVQSGQVKGWQARKIAQMTHQLSWEAAVDVDTAVTGYVGTLPWPRFEKVLEAAIIDADPTQAEEREQRARTARDVWAGRTEDGLRTVVARALQGDATLFLATVNRIAEILAADGDVAPVGVLRSKAFGILGQPAVALQLLIAHQHDQPAPDQPVEPRPEDEGPRDAEPEDGEPTESEPGPQEGHRSLDLSPLPLHADLSAARPRVTLNFHVNSDTVLDGHGMIRPEEGEAWTLEEFLAWLTAHQCHVTIRPVVDPAHEAAVDAYETPTRIREFMRIRHPAEVFPYGVGTTAHLDMDHTVPYVPMASGGPPGQTGLGNLGPLSRSSHRAVTHGGWRRRQPEPGRYVFRSPIGFTYLVTNQGTLPLGRNQFADQVWRAAAPAGVLAA